MSDRSYLTQTELMILLAIMRLKDEAYGVPISAEILTVRGARLLAVRTRDSGAEARGREVPLGEATAMRGGRAKTIVSARKATHRCGDAARPSGVGAGCRSKAGLMKALDRRAAEPKETPRPDGARRS